MQSQILLGEAALSGLGCLLGLHTQAANHCRLVRYTEGNAETSDSVEVLKKITSKASDGIDVC